MGQTAMCGRRQFQRRRLLAQWKPPFCCMFCLRNCKNWMFCKGNSCRLKRKRQLKLSKAKNILPDGSVCLSLCFALSKFFTLPFSDHPICFFCNCVFFQARSFLNDGAPSLTSMRATNELNVACCANSANKMSQNGTNRIRQRMTRFLSASVAGIVHPGDQPSGVVACDISVGSGGGVSVPS